MALSLRESEDVFPNILILEGCPCAQVPVTSELGCVTPWMVVPGPWTAKELQHYAKHLAGAFGDNLSCNCLSPKVVILAKGWEHTEEFISIFKVSEQL